MAASDMSFISGVRNSFNLGEFLECYRLPKCGKVVGHRGFQSQSLETPIKCGDYICLHTLAVDNVVLSFYDADTGSRREVRVPADSNMKFNVIPPGENNKVMPQVADVLEECPLKFKANAACDDPYLPAIFRKGEQFRYLKKCRCPNDRTIYLECEDASGNVLQLPKSCKGDFTTVEDSTSYSLREIISFGAVSRKLRLSSENVKLVPMEGENNETASEEQELPMYANVKNSDGALSRITGLPLTFSSIITMQAPELFLLVSPKDRLDEKWKVPLNLNIDLVACADDEYEVPVQRERNLLEFISDFEQDLPLVANISRYENIPAEFSGILHRNLEILIHGVETSEKILAKSGSKYYCIGKSVRGRFRKALKRFKSVSEFENFSEALTVKVMEDIASDVPEPFSLKTGDILKFENYNVQTIKVRYGKKTYSKCDTILCEQIENDNKTKQVRLPTDLELSMIEILPENEQDGNDINFVFSKSMEFPMTVDFLPTDHCSNSILPFDTEIELLHRVSDPLVLISLLPVERNKRISGLDARVDPCFLVPVRHNLYLKLKNKLHFPPNYFRFPRRDKWISKNVELIDEETYRKLIKYNDQAYEDYDPRSQRSSSIDNVQTNADSKPRRFVRASMTILPQIRKRFTTHPLKTDRKYRSDGNLVDSTKTEENDSSDTERNDERIYELYEAPARREERKAGQKLKNKIRKKFSLRRKKDSNG